MEVACLKTAEDPTRRRLLGTFITHESGLKADYVKLSRNWHKIADCSVFHLE